MKHIKRFDTNSLNEKKVIFEKDGKSCISYYDDEKSLDEIKELLNKGDIREQMVADFKKELGNSDSDSTLGYVLEILNKRKYFSRISNISIGDPNQSYGGY